MTTSASSYARALWWENGQEPAPAIEILEGAQAADVAIVGGGYTGASAALHLAEAGSKVLLLEARHVGFGASGRNGGQVIPGLKYDPDLILQKFGPNEGEQLIELVGGAANYVFDLIDRFAIACQPNRTGWIQAAHSARAIDAIHKRARQWQARGVPVELLDHPAMTERVGTPDYFGGWHDPRAGSVQPLDYLRGLVRAAMSAGARVYQESPVQSLERRGDEWRLRTDVGAVIAKQVLIATNGYTGDLVPGLRRSILPVQSIQLATGPLDGDIDRKILPGGEVLSETRKLAFYMRRTPAGGFMIGGRGAVGDLEDDRLMDALHRHMVRTFPALAAAPISHRWSGHVALTLDGLPHLHEPAPGLFACLGYNGRGIGLATAFGRMLSETLLRSSVPTFPKSPVRAIPWHPIRRPVMGIGIRSFWIKDAIGLPSA